MLSSVIDGSIDLELRREIRTTGIGGAPLVAPVIKDRLFLTGVDLWVPDLGEAYELLFYSAPLESNGSFWWKPGGCSSYLDSERSSDTYVLCAAIPPR